MKTREVWKMYARQRSRPFRLVLYAFFLVVFAKDDTFYHIDDFYHIIFLVFFLALVRIYRDMWSPEDILEYPKRTVLYYTDDLKKMTYMASAVLCGVAFLMGLRGVLITAVFVGLEFAYRMLPARSTLKSYIHILHYPTVLFMLSGLEIEVVENLSELSAIFIFLTLEKRWSLRYVLIFSTLAFLCLLPGANFNHGLLILAGFGGLIASTAALRTMLVGRYVYIAYFLCLRIGMILIG